MTTDGISEKAELSLWYVEKSDGTAAYVVAKSLTCAVQNIPAATTARRLAVQTAPNVFMPKKSPQNPVTAVDAACRCLGVTTAAICQRSRNRIICRARWIVLFVLREAQGWSYSECAAAVGMRSHQSVMHAVKKTWNSVTLRNDETLCRDIRKVWEQLLHLGVTEVPLPKELQ